MKKEKQRQKPPPLKGITRQESQNTPQRLAMAPHLQSRQPLIIHTFSPEVIHANAYEFMNLVQRLTGRSSHVSPPSKRPRYAPHCMLPPSPGMHRASVSSEVHLASSSHMPQLRCTALKEQHPASLARFSLTPQEEQHNSISELASRRGLSPRVRLGLRLQTDLSPQERVGAGVQSGILANSPVVFEFSPSMLPTPPAFYLDFPRLSPYTEVSGLLSPILMKAGAVPKSPMVMPAFLPSPVPLTSAFLADLPALSPAAHRWIDKHPLSTELILSPLSRGIDAHPGMRTFFGNPRSLM